VASGLGYQVLGLGLGSQVLVNITAAICDSSQKLTISNRFPITSIRIEPSGSQNRMIVSASIAMQIESRFEFVHHCKQRKNNEHSSDRPTFFGGPSLPEHSPLSNHHFVLRVCKHPLSISSRTARVTRSLQQRTSPASRSINQLINRSINRLILSTP